MSASLTRVDKWSNMDPIKKVVPFTSCSIHLLRSFRLPAILMGFNPLKWPLWEEHCCRDYNFSLTLVIPTDHCARSIIRGRKLIKEDQTVNCKGVPGCIFANNGLARAQSHAHAYYPWFSVRVDMAMSTENLLMVTVMRTTIALIFFGHDLSHTHTENLRLE